MSRDLNCQSKTHSRDDDCDANAPLKLTSPSCPPSPSLSLSCLSFLSFPPFSPSFLSLQAGWKRRRTIKLSKHHLLLTLLPNPPPSPSLLLCLPSFPSPPLSSSLLPLLLRPLSTLYKETMFTPPSPLSSPPTL